jgi:ATPase family protein associated with various cellular activities (AAA)
MSTPPTLPAWAVKMRDLFRSGSVAQFILHGNVFDVIPHGDRQVSLKQFLDEAMFASYDTVLHYDRSRGVRASRGGDDWSTWLQQALGDANPISSTREPGVALELIDRYLLRTLNLAAIQQRTAVPPAPAADGSTPAGQRKVAVVIDFAEFVVPRADAAQLGGPFAANVVKVLGWANDTAILQANVITVLIAEGLHDLNALVSDNPHTAEIKLPLPDEAEMTAYVDSVASGPIPDLAAKSDVPLATLGQRLTGLSRVGARRLLTMATRSGQRLTADWVARVKKELIESECQGLLDFIESKLTLDDMAGSDSVKAWLREDAALLQKGALHALPMGYLVAGRIGTGKTYLVQCWAGELGIPCVVFKNFRDKWVGATESNLEKIFSVLKAIGQVLVFVDEADQAAGKREGGDTDGGLSGRVYAMLAKEMSDTRNRGRILWVFATSRPDLLEVDLKRQGRLDVHIPLFAPETPDEMRALFRAIARKLKFPLKDEDLPALDPSQGLGSNEIEGVLVRALRVWELAPDPTNGVPKPPLRDILAGVLREVRPSAHTRKLEYMDLVAVKECTDQRFLPPRFRDLTPEQIEARITELRRFVAGG